MTINNLNISYPDFKLNEIIDPEQFDINNKEVVDKVNEIRTLVNKLTDGWVVTNTDSTTTDKAGAELIDLNAIAPFASTKLQAFLQEVIDRLQSTTDASSGADFIASTTITGVTGTTVQAQLESLKALLDSLTTRVQNDENALNTHKTTATLDHPDGSVITAKLANSSVTNAKIADSSVSTAKFVNLAITTAKLADASVSRAKIANGAVDLSKADATSFDTRYYTEAEIDNKLSDIAGGESYSFRKGTAFPTSPIEGDVFYRTDLDIGYIYDGLRWENVNKSFTFGITFPVSPREWDMFGLTAEQVVNGVTHPIGVYVYRGSKWKLFVDSGINKQSSIIPYGQSIIETDQKTPLDIEMKGLSRINHMGIQGDFRSQFNRWGTNLAIDTAVSKFGTSSGKIDNSAGTAYKASFNNQKMHLNGKYVLVGIWAKAASGTPDMRGVLRGRDSADATTSELSFTKTIDSTWKLYYAKFDLSAKTDDHWISRLDVVTFGTADDVVNFDGMIVHELTQAEFDRVHTQAEIEAEYAYVDSVKHIQNPVFVSYGKNLLPSFNEWTLHANATVIEPYKLELVATGTNQHNRFTVNCVKNTDYTLSLTHNGYINVTDGGNTTILLAPTTAQSATFNSGNFDSLLITLNNAGLTSGTFTFTNPQLELGSVATTFTEHNPTYLYGKDAKIGANLDGSVADQLYYSDANNRWEKLGRFKDLVLDGSLGWTYYTDYAGYKKVNVLLNNSQTNGGQVVKYDGAILTKENKNGTSDDAYVHSNGNLYVTIPDTDSGWLEAWTGTTLTADWISANFNGWRYTGDGTTHTWVSKYDGANAPTQTLAYVSANRASGMTDDNAYKLSYELADSVVEPVTMEGDLTLIEGLNQVSLDSGVIVREKANPVQGVSVYNINNTAGGSELKNRAKKIINVYRGEEVDTAWYHDADINSYGDDQVKIPEELFDTTKSYYVTYLLKDKHLFTTNPLNAEGSYNTNLKTVVDKHTDQIANLNTKQSVQDIWNKDVAVKGEGDIVQRGKFAITASANTEAVETITFPRAFSETPTVVMWIHNVNDTHNFTIYKFVSNLKSTTQMDARLKADTAQEYRCSWIAIGK